MGKIVPEPTYKRFIVGKLKRFDERNHIYSRVDREAIISAESIPKGGHSKSAVHQLFTFSTDRKDQRGYSRTDYALRWAGRTIDYVARKNLHGREIEPTPPPVEVDDPKRMTNLIKKTAKWFGADLVGIVPLDRTWVYSH